MQKLQRLRIRLWHSCAAEKQNIKLQNQPQLEQNIICFVAVCTIKKLDTCEQLEQWEETYKANWTTGTWLTLHLTRSAPISRIITKFETLSDLLRIWTIWFHHQLCLGIFSLCDCVNKLDDQNFSSQNEQKLCILLLILQWPLTANHHNSYICLILI